MAHFSSVAPMTAPPSPPAGASADAAAPAGGAPFASALASALGTAAARRGNAASADDGGQVPDAASGDAVGNNTQHSEDLAGALGMGARTAMPLDPPTTEAADDDAAAVQRRLEQQRHDGGANGGTGAISLPAGMRMAGASAGHNAADMSDVAAEAAAPAARADDVRRNAAASARTAATSTVQNDLSLLQPAFRAPLERVIARMEALGHTVHVVETQRGQARQDHLYEQGRTRPGQVVTWTRNSNHLAGNAADLLIDGSYTARAGYDTLARVAAEEGLRTLGSRDPGHVELPGASAGRAHGIHGPHTSSMAGVMPASGIAPVATVAAPAAVAPVATTARTAAPAAIAATAAVAGAAHRHGGTASGSRIAGGAAPAVADLPVLATPASPDVRLADTSAPADQLSLRAAADAEGEASSFSDAGGDARPLTGPGGMSARGDGAAAPAGNVSAAVETDIASRIARVLQLQADAAAQPLSRVMLHLGEDAQLGRVRIDLRGGAVGTTIDLNDPAAASDLRARLHELETALNRRGLEAAELRVGAGTAQAAARVQPLTAGPGVEPASQNLLETLLAQYTARSGDRHSEGGRNGSDSQRRSRGDQSRQEAK